MSVLEYETDFPYAVRKCKEIAGEMADFFCETHMGNFCEGHEDVLHFMAKMIQVHAQMYVIKCKMMLYQEMRNTGRDGDAELYVERVLQPSQQELDEILGELHNAYESLAINSTSETPPRQVYNLYEQRMREYRKTGITKTVKPEESP